MVRKTTELTIEDVRKLLRRKCREAGSISAFAHEHGFTRQYLHRVLQENTPVSGSICEAIGLRYAGERWVRK